MFGVWMIIWVWVGILLLLGLWSEYFFWYYWNIVLIFYRCIFDCYGFGVGGIRNIVGNGVFYFVFEDEIVFFYWKEVVFVFLFCYVVNDVCFVIIGVKFFGCVIFFDVSNYVFMI